MIESSFKKLREECGITAKKLIDFATKTDSGTPDIQGSLSASEPPSEFRVEQIAHKILCHQLLMSGNSALGGQEAMEVIALMEKLGFMGWPFDPDISQLETLLNHT